MVCLSVEGVVAISTEQGVVSGATAQLVVAVCPFETVAAAAPVEGVVAVAALEHVRVAVARQGVAAAAAFKVLDVALMPCQRVGVVEPEAVRARIGGAGGQVDGDAVADALEGEPVRASVTADGVGFVPAPDERVVAGAA